MNPSGLFLLDDDGTRKHVVVEEEGVYATECLLLKSARINTGLDKSIVNSLGTLLGNPLVGPCAAGLLVSIAVDNIYAVVLGAVDGLSIELDAGLVLAGEGSLTDLEEDGSRCRNLVVDKLLDLLNDFLLDDLLDDLRILLYSLVGESLGSLLGDVSGGSGGSGGTGNLAMLSTDCPYTVESDAGGSGSLAVSISVTED